MVGWACINEPKFIDITLLWYQMAYCDTQNNEARHHLTARDLHLMSHQSLVKTLPNLMLACHKNSWLFKTLRFAFICNCKTFVSLSELLEAHKFMIESFDSPFGGHLKFKSGIIWLG